MCFFFSSRRRHTRCALVTGVQTCALPIFARAGDQRGAGKRAPRSPAEAFLKGAPMADCPHRRLDVHLNQAHFGDTNVKYFELTATCEVCGVDMTLPGVPDVGQSPDKRMVTIDAPVIRFTVIAMGE